MHVVLGAEILLAQNRLTLTAVAEERDQEASAEQRTSIAVAPAIMTAIIWTCPGTWRSAAARSRPRDRRTDTDLFTDRLRRFVTLAGDDDHVAGLRHLERRGKGSATVGFTHNTFTVVAGYPGEHGIDDGLRVLRSRVVRSHDDQFGQFRGDRTHFRTLFTIAVATTSEDRDHATGTRASGHE